MPYFASIHLLSCRHQSHFQPTIKLLLMPFYTSIFVTMYLHLFSDKEISLGLSIDRLCLIVLETVRQLRRWSGHFSSPSALYENSLSSYSYRYVSTAYLILNHFNFNFNHTIKSYFILIIFVSIK